MVLSETVKNENVAIEKCWNDAIANESAPIDCEAQGAFESGREYDAGQSIVEGDEEMATFTGVVWMILNAAPLHYLVTSAEF